MLNLNVESVTGKYIENIVSAVEAEFEVHDEIASDFDFLELDEQEVIENGKLVVQNGLDAQIISALEKLKVTRMKEGGLSSSMLRSYFNGYGKIEDLVKMIDHGPLVHQRVDWIPNGAAGLHATL